MEQASHQTKSWLLYDGECPFCTRYVHYTRLKDAAGAVRLIDAREAGPEADEANVMRGDMSIFGPRPKPWPPGRRVRLASAAAAARPGLSHLFT